MKLWKCKKKSEKSTYNQHRYGPVTITAKRLKMPLHIYNYVQRLLLNVQDFSKCGKYSINLH